GAFPTAVVLGDFRGQGVLDIATANQGFGGQGVSVLLGNGDGTFQPELRTDVGPYPFALAVGDFNGDGHQDLAVADEGLGGGGNVAVLLRNGDGTFRTAATYPFQFAKGIVVSDFNKDGRSDLAVIFNSEVGDEVGVLLGNGDGTFRTAGSYPAG